MADTTVLTVFSLVYSLAVLLLRYRKGPVEMGS